ncbi:MAG: PepSY domain-containing protein [Acidobacteria bacterium]|nr:PepSY domain-containing protein [Acidobacteriota bacterium]
MFKRALIVVHRWLGVLLCAVFLLWFPSGIGIMYWPFPTVTAADRLARSPALDPATVRLSPAEALARLGIERSPEETRLHTFDGRPVYRFAGGRGLGTRIVYADSGEEQTEVTRGLMDRAAAAWTGQPMAAATVEPVEEVDQWTVQAPLRTLRPMWKYSWPNGEQVYVSGTDGEVVQYTTRASRLGAYVGAIPHWLYFTPLRKHQPVWIRVVIWTSGVGTILALMGVVIGVWMYSPSKKYRYAGAPSSIPYTGQKRWHTVFGLVVGIAAATWAFSGMLSVDPFPNLRRPAPGRRDAPSVAQALRGRVVMADFAARHPADVLRDISHLTVKELEFTSFDGQAVYAARLEGGGTQIVPVQGGPIDGFDPERIVGIVRAAAPVPAAVETRVIDQYDLYYLDRTRRQPLPVVLALMNDADKTRYYIDPKTARVVRTYSNRNWVSRWLYNGLHSLNFPWLYNHRPLWDIVVIAFMLGGTALSVTSLVLAWRVLGRKVATMAAAAAVAPVPARRAGLYGPPDPGAS